ALSFVSTASSIINAPAPYTLYTLSLHDALPICHDRAGPRRPPGGRCIRGQHPGLVQQVPMLPQHSVRLPVGEHPRLLAEHHQARSEEHTSELQSRFDLVCRLLLEKKNEEKRSDS